VLVRSPKGGDKPTALLFATSIFDIRLDLPPAEDVEIKDGLRIYKLPAALISCAPRWFAAHPIEMTVDDWPAQTPSRFLERSA
jgi:hypothetical protein